MMEAFLCHLPKIELHVHIEGTMEPDLMFALAKRNSVTLPFESVETLNEAYERFVNLQSFLDLIREGLRVLVTSEDFFDLAWIYFQRVATDNVRHCEVFVDVQAHLARGVTLKTQFDGLTRARKKANKELNITSSLILNFMRDLSEESALEILHESLQYRDHFIGIGLDSAESGNPPSKFVRLFEKAHKLGLHRVAHAGEEGPASYVREAIELLNVERIDHGIRCVDDRELMEKISEHRIPLTICPVSNLKLKVVKKMSELPLQTFLEAGIKITINSDDPAYFRAYILENFRAVQKTFRLSMETWIQFTRNAIDAAFISAERRQEIITELETLS